MCRKTQVLYTAAAAFGLGLLVSLLFNSSFLCGCLGLIFLLSGIFLLTKK